MISQNLWGSCNFSWVAKASSGRSRGMISIWDAEKFVVSSYWDFDGALVVKGCWGQERTKCCIFNIYAPCNSSSKLELWEHLKVEIQQNRDCCICLAGDFNAIKEINERVGQSENINLSDIRAFDEFIREVELIDLPPRGRKFTCYRTDGSCKSRIDRIMVCNRWLTIWPTVTIRGLTRTVSDHCPVIMEAKVVDWGPKPFRFINAWCTHPEFKKIVEVSWNSYDVEG